MPKLFEQRSRETAMSLVQVTERDCARNADTDWDVARTARERRTFPPLPEDFDPTALDNTHAPEGDTQNCENEPPETDDEEEDEEEGDDEEEEDEPILHVDCVHSDGRPAYLEPDEWDEIRQLRAAGEHEEAAELDAECRENYIICFSRFWTALPAQAA